MERNLLANEIKVAFGTGVILGLWQGQLAAAPTTAHFLTHYDGRCSANCKFCPQARESTTDIKMLSRVTWPKYDLNKVFEALHMNSKKFTRVCVQSINFPGVLDVLCQIVDGVKKACKLPISVSCQPLKKGNIQKLADIGVNRVSVALDAATPEIFEQVKGGRYFWEGHLKSLDEAREIFGDRVSTHLIVGLGETEEDVIRTVQLLHDRGITLALFAFTPIRGTALSKRPKPNVSSYRKIQLARFLIANNLGEVGRMEFKAGKIVDFGVESGIFTKAVKSGEPFRTSGCSGCNRPFYNESPRGPIYNYPRKPKLENIKAVKDELNLAT